MDAGSGTNGFENLRALVGQPSAGHRVRTVDREAENSPEAGHKRDEERMKTISRNLLLAVAAGALTGRRPSINLGR